ncbi:hypothetical protein DMC30DRAFT_26251 [Rhodotorula diobovata]|uniref:Uncharacterized protein n=1 Tax=Rhodotorula diobovata TaxID=5288 RepID=A0A5C5FQB5_9BASI|nr:hypothetical protein DMC30DRAFT_26251 [Rhodotorula diobovata]
MGPVTAVDRRAQDAGRRMGGARRQSHPVASCAPPEDDQGARQASRGLKYGPQTTSRLARANRDRRASRADLSARPPSALGVPDSSALPLGPLHLSLCGTPPSPVQTQTPSQLVARSEPLRLPASDVLVAAKPLIARLWRFLRPAQLRSPRRLQQLRQPFSLGLERRPRAVLRRPASRARVVHGLGPGDAQVPGPVGLGRRWLQRRRRCVRAGQPGAGGLVRAQPRERQLGHQGRRRVQLAHRPPRDDEQRRQL